MSHQLPALPYAYNALEPIIDEQTVVLHHDKHHATYVNNLNVALENQAQLAGLSLAELLGNLAQVPEAIRTAVKNNGGQHYAHSLYWECMTPGGAKEPQGELRVAIEKAFGSMDAFKEKFVRTGVTQFGSGWAWLALGKAGEVTLYSTANAETPFERGERPLLVMDVWEHAYYLKYQNRRPDYANAFMGLVNWDVVGAKYAAAVER